jgi:xylan 1,4-beta-xylosidase
MVQKNRIAHSFQMEHSPRGAEAAFSLGLVGFGGGFTLEEGKTGDQPVHIGFYRDGVITELPYCAEGGRAVDSGMAEFVPTGEDHGPARNIVTRFVSPEGIRRELGLATDTWTTDGLTLTLATPVDGVPDPDSAPIADLRDSLAPAVTGELVFDNRTGSSPMTGFFAVGGFRGLGFLADTTGGELVGIEALEGCGFAVRGAEGIRAFSDFGIDWVFARPEPQRTRLTGLAGLLVDVPAGQRRVIPLALGWYRAGAVTLGRSCSYFYTRHFANLGCVLDYALQRAEDWLLAARQHDARLQESGLNPHRQFLIAKSLRSYWGSTQLLQEGRRWRWVVNEGSCNMINTLDLAVDMAFFEAAHHPWLLRNVLDAYADEYSYPDEVHFPDDPDTPHPGGVSFTHDHGNRNVFAPSGYSHYELTDHPGCFSYMTHEELLNWVLCAGVYFHATGDLAWLHRRATLLADCLESMQNRDHPDATQRDGLMSLDSNRCGRESEITTYDSLDPSLGQARRNSYMGVKCWAGYLALEWLLGQDSTARWGAEIEAAQHSADLAAQTITAAFDEQLGYIPAILEGDDRSAIIPVIEALVYPQQMGLRDAIDPEGRYGPMIAALSRSLETVLKPGVCLFPDGGWKLSGSNDNSWMSKIFICQYVAERILRIDPGEKGIESDLAHDHWWRYGCAQHSVVDQVIAGGTPAMERGSKYPRCVSCFLWLQGHDD